jgi:hypothetical protein
VRRADERIALYVDLENILYQPRQARDLDAGVVSFAALVHGLTARGTLVARIAFGNQALVREVALPLSNLGMRCHVHEGGENGADIALLEALDLGLPASCGTVVLASGDHIFASAARRLRAEGKRVEVVARPGAISFELYLAADAFSAFTTLDYEVARLVSAHTERARARA